ncbi:MAG: hypothetical protein Q4E81_09040, partial [Succinatimonas sp.]|nr:hypothetical protein [Succinatimonas sp.]
MFVIADFSIKNVSFKSVGSIKRSLENEVTLSINFKNMMKNRERGEAVNSTANSLTTDMADWLKDLKYVKNYNYIISINVDSNLIAVENESQEIDNDMGMPKRENERQDNTSDFSLQANTTMKYLSDFTDE